MTFHDGKGASAEVIRNVLRAQLPGYVGPAFADVSEIRNVGADQIEFSLSTPSALLIEGLDVPIEAPGGKSVGTGPFILSAQGSDKVEMTANSTYYGGKPLLDRVVLMPYGSVRAAWADLLRDQVDMLYEVGVDALESLQPSTEVRLFNHERGYAYLAILNVKKPFLKNRDLRRQLNAAIDRQALISEVFKSHGTAADGPIWPSHWAREDHWPALTYSPRPVVIKHDDAQELRCLFADASLERLALNLQRQLAAIGVRLVPELTSVDKFYERAAAGDFDVLLADTVHGPSPLRSYWFWHTGGPYNWGHFSSPAVDASLDSIRHAPDDAAYKAGVAAFQRAIVDDPPAIFLAWSERARAVSTRFEVPVEPGRDVLSTLRLWRPIADPRMRSPN